MTNEILEKKYHNIKDEKNIFRWIVFLFLTFFLSISCTTSPKGTCVYTLSDEVNVCVTTTIVKECPDISSDLGAGVEVKVKPIFSDLYKTCVQEGYNVSCDSAKENKIFSNSKRFCDTYIY